MPTAVTRENVVTGLERLGARGKRFIVHASLRSFGRVEGGARAVADALTEVGQTVLVPTFTFSPAAIPPPDERIPRNGCDYETDRLGDGHPTRFTPDLPVARPIGAVAEAVRLAAGAVRSTHPLSSFAACGVDADRYVAEQSYDAPMRPVARLADDDGWVLMMGTDWTSCTTVHRGEELVGRRPFVRWALCADGEVRAVRVGGCSEGFNALSARVAGIGEVTVGMSVMRFVPMSAVLDATIALLKQNPTALACSPPCRRCIDAAAGGPD